MARLKTNPVTQLDKLILMWSALYTDGSRLLQFDEAGTERLFKEIDQDRLEKFIVSNEFKEVIVNLKTGEIKISGVKLDFCYGPDIEYRLIYFRRVRRTMGYGAPTITEHVGWQATVQGSEGNVKRIIGIGPEKITIQCD